MVKRLIHRLLLRRHFWRHVGFDELSELYVSMMFRGLAVSLTGLFVPVYLLQLGFSVSEICMVVGWYFTFRFSLLDIVAGYCVARFGPKHTLLVGYVALIASTVLFLTLGTNHWPLWLLGGVWGASASFFFIPFNVDFSKVNHKEHGGKELGWTQIMEKSGSALGPLVGGIVATIFGGQYIFLVAALLLILGVIPLFLTAEPVRTRQHLDFRGLKLKGLERDFLSAAGYGIEHSISMLFWPLFMGLFVLGTSAVYAKLGVLYSVSIAAAIVSAGAIGQMIDTHKGRKLLRYSASITAVTHIIRPFVASYSVAFGINILNEAAMPGFRMSYFRGLFGAADDLPGYRIVFLTAIEMFSSLVKAVVWWLLALLAYGLEIRIVMFIGFGMAAAASLLMMTERFKALNPRRI